MNGNKFNSHIKALLAEQDFQYQKSIASDKVNTGANFHLNDIIGGQSGNEILEAPRLRKLPLVT